MKRKMVSSSITLHYITSFHTPVTPKVTNGASTKSFKFSECKLEKVSFQKFLKVSVFVSSWRLDGREFHAFGPENEKLRSPNFSFNCGSSYQKLLEDLSLSRPGRSATDVIMSDKYAGLRPTHTRCMSTQSL